MLGLTCTDGFVYQLVEVVVVREYHMTSHVEKKSLRCNISACQASSFVERVDQQPVLVLVLFQARSCPETCWTGPDDENVDALHFGWIIVLYNGNSDVILAALNIQIIDYELVTL